MTHPPETLKKIAEALGHTNIIIDDGQVITNCGWFQPASMANPQQREEILLWLLSKGWTFRPSIIGYLFKVAAEYSDVFIQAEDYTTALLQAAAKQVGSK